MSSDKMDGMDKLVVSRRSFLKGAAAGAVGVATMGILGACTPTETTPATSAVETPAPDSNPPPATVEPVATPVDDGLIGASKLNPQDYDYRQNTTDFKTLFSPLKIGTIQLNHRMVKSAAGSATYINGPTDEMFQYYVNFAKGGIELIYVEGVGWMRPEPAVTSSGVVVPKEDAVAFAKKLVDECGKYGAVLGFQMGAFAPKPLAELTKEEIQKIEDDLVTNVKWFRDAGFRAWEFHITGGGMANAFLSRCFNPRTDEYGTGSLENRTRFITETIKKVKQACGDDIAIQLLVEAVTENDNLTNNNGSAFRTLDNNVTYPNTRATTIEEGVACAKIFEAAGADAIHLRLGMIDYHPAQFGSDLYFSLNGLEGANAYGWQWDFSRHFQGEIIANHSGAGMLLNVAKRYKEALNIPCGTVTYMDPAHAPDFFEQALADGKVDYYEMTRPLTVDTEYVNKLREGRIDEIAPCTRCLHCHIGSNENNRLMGYCRVNALTQRVMTDKGPATYELPPASSKKKVMVIGGGPGGMEAARIAAARGHDVTLYEKKGMLGGQLDFANIVKGPHENLSDLKAYLIKQLELKGVNVVLGKEVDSGFIKAEAPDAVILATGALYDELKINGDNSVPVIEYEQFMFTDMGENVIVYGSNAQAFDCALWLTVHKKRVTMVTPNPDEDLDKQQSHHNIRFMTTALYALGVRVWPKSTLKEIANGKVTIAAASGSFDVTIDCDAIVNAGDLLPNTGLLEGVSNTETHAVGDCANPYNIGLAIQTGNDAGRAV